ncbi:MAG: hypothetical protein IJC02_08330 [Lachnospiraceae bacterium]|nr:hypothetical protein [Lachnospiraceae bacterium]
MANYERKEYLVRIISDALADYVEQKEYMQEDDNVREQYQIAKADYESLAQLEEA